MISVILDEEIVSKFGCKAHPYTRFPFAPGSVVCKYPWAICWSFYKSPDVWVFSRGTYTQEFDEEFTEWLKIHRPEVFL